MRAQAAGRRPANVGGSTPAAASSQRRRAGAARPPRPAGQARSEPPLLLAPAAPSIAALQPREDAHAAVARRAAHAARRAIHAAQHALDAAGRRLDGVALVLAAALRRVREPPVPVEPVPAWPSLGLMRPVAAVSAVRDPEAAPSEPDTAAQRTTTGRAKRRTSRSVPRPPLPADAPDASTPLALIIAAQAAALTATEADKRWMSASGQSVAVERVRSTPAQRIGDDGERLAALRLASLGWAVLARNLRVGRTEVDLLAIDPSDPPTLVVVEVRRRTRRDFGLAEETVDRRKRLALMRAVGDLAGHPVLPDGRRLPDLPVRVDLIAIDQGPDGRPSIRHHRGIDI